MIGSKQAQGFKSFILIVFSCINAMVSAQGTGDTVRAVYIDEHNQKWFGTDRGLLQFDGFDWRAYYTALHAPGVIYSLANEVTGEGSEFWIGTDEGISVARYDIDGLNSAIRYNTENSALLSNKVVDIVLDYSNTRYFATPEGLGVLEEDQWSWLEKGWGPSDAGVPNHKLLSLGAQKDTVYVGAVNRGAGRIVNEVDGFSGASYYEQPWAGIAGNTVLSIFSDSRGHQWFGTTDGLSYHTRQESNQGWKQPLTTDDGLVNDTVNAIFEDSEGYYWIGTNGGVSKFDLENLQFTNYTVEDGLNNDLVFDIAEDQDHTLWFATADGVTSLEGTDFTSYSTAEQAKNFIDIFTGINNPEAASGDNISIYPIPASDHLYIHYRNPGVTHILISAYSISGKLAGTIYEGNPAEDEIIVRWDLHDPALGKIQQGIYFIRINTPTSSVTRKIILF